jgi:IrrE N-terminal-like domain
MNRGVLANLRTLCPPRRLTQGEALRVAELQAAKLLELSAIECPPLAETIISKVPKVQVRRISPWPVSGCTDWAKGTWVIVVNGAEPEVRQRFTIAHEFKHILDYPFIDVLYPANLGMSPHQRAEKACDYFAGCLLVPRPWLKRAWVSGLQDTAKLARHFGVSQQAVQTRLLQTGLIDRPGRCMDVGRGWRFLRIGDWDNDCVQVPSIEAITL